MATGSFAGIWRFYGKEQFYRIDGMTPSVLSIAVSKGGALLRFEAAKPFMDVCVHAGALYIICDMPKSGGALKKLSPLLD
jgi:hypothetical protein